MEKEEKEILSYTFVLHNVRIELNLSLNDYCIADCIYNLSHNPRSKIQGWCYASKITLGDLIGISETSVHSILNKLIRLKIVEKDKDTKYLRTTQLWYDNVILKRIDLRKLSQTKESLVKTLKKVKPDTKESLVNKNKDKNKDISVSKTDEYSFSNSLKEMLNSKQIHIQIIGIYWKWLNWKFENKIQYQAALKRDLRSASALKGYSLNRIKKTFKELDRQSDNGKKFNWNLSTVHKYIDNIKI